MTSYLDYAASSPIKPDVIKIVAHIMAECGNASSVHGYGRKARECVEQARANIAARYNAKPQQVIFTSGATEANNMALRGNVERCLIVSAIEHPSVMQTALAITQPQIIPVNTHGVVDVQELEAMLQKNPKSFISVMLVNNETGVIQPIKEITQIARKYDAIIHCDAVQAAGRMPVNMMELGVDMLSISAHKMGGPQGVGALIVAERIKPEPFITGGSQEQRRRAGTENVAAIAGFGRAVELLDDDFVNIDKWRVWRDAFEARITENAPKAIIFGRNAPRIATLSCMAMPMMRNDTQLMAFDLSGIAVSSGSACSSGKVQASPVLKAMGADDALATTAIRVSFGWATQAVELEALTVKWIELYQRQHKNKAA